MPEAVQHHFSKRAEQVREWLAAHGAEGAKAAEAATLSTRAHKPDIDRPALFDADRLLIDHLIEPTRIYVKSLLGPIRQGRIHALAHITGGGLLENVPRVLPKGLHARIDAGAWEQPRLMAFLQAQGIAVTSYMTLAYGKVLQDPVLARIAAKHQATVAQVALAWALQLGYAVIPSSTRREHLASNLRAQDLALDAEDMAAIATLERHGREVNPEGLAPAWD